MISKCLNCGSDDLDMGYSSAGRNLSYFSDKPISKFLNIGKKSKAVLCASCGFLHPFLPKGEYEEFSQKSRTENKKSI